MRDYVFRSDADLAEAEWEVFNVEIDDTLARPHEIARLLANADHADVLHDRTRTIKVHGRELSIADAAIMLAFLPPDGAKIIADEIFEVMRRWIGEVIERGEDR